MKRASPGKRTGRLWLSGGIAALLTAAVGVTLFLFTVGGGVTRLSYDALIAFRNNLAVTNAVVVYMDDASHRELNQPFAAPWNRAIHAQLIAQLTAQGAKAVVFDILFTEPSSDPSADEHFATAVEQSGRVILAGNYQERETISGAVGRWEELPYEPFRKAAVAWGNVNFIQDPDYGIRRFFPTLENVSGLAFIPWLPAVVARAAGAPESSTRSDPSESRWLNYYGPPGTIPSASYFQALQPDGVPPGFFKDKIVFVGAQLSADFSGKGKDEFRTPYAYWGRGFAPGVEIHATGALNLLRGDWLNRFPFLLELILMWLVAVAAGYGLVRVHPLFAVGLTLAAMVLVAVTGHYLAWRHHLWFAWLIVVCELAVALLCSVVYNSLRLYVEKRLLEESLAVHLSPVLVKRMLSDPDLRRRGGAKQEVSLLFTDIENFSRISETMIPDDMLNLLNRYFQVALECIHETDGTVMDLVGDAIFAIWNAPVEQPDHRERACQAALSLRQRLVQFDDVQRGLVLRTRVGLHSGIVCVGNIGGAQRFDYTVVGENANLGSRLEGLNKHFGTDVLATREIQRVVEGKLTSRLIGYVQVKGFGRAVEVHELLGSAEMAETSRPWREKFAAALHLFRGRQFDAAEKAFRETIALRTEIEERLAGRVDRPNGDGPSLFYLNTIAKFRVSPPPDDWIGEVSMKEK
jgi:adenylate cyclase